MANVLAAIGRARPTQNVLDVIRGGVELDQNRRRNELTAADLAMSAEKLEQAKRQGEYDEMVRQEGETPIPIETLASRFEGGDQGPMFKMVYDMADKSGYVDKTAGGLGTIKRRHLPEVGQLMSDPDFVSKLSRTRIDYWRGQYNQIKTALAEKPTDKKLLEALAQADTGFNQAVAHDAQLMAYEKQRIDEQEADAKTLAAQAAMKKALKENDPKTAMEAFLKLRPNASTDEIAAFQQKLFKPSSVFKGLTVSQQKARILDEVFSGRPLDDLSEVERSLLDSATGGRTKGVEQQALDEWQAANPGKSIMEFHKEYSTQRIISTEEKAAMPTITEAYKIENQPGYMSEKARKVVDDKLKSNAKLKANVMAGKISADNLAVESMAPWVKEVHPEAFLWESPEGVYLWVLEDGTVVADQNGWVK